MLDINGSPGPIFEYCRGCGMVNDHVSNRRRLKGDYLAMLIIGDCIQFTICRRCGSDRTKLDQLGSEVTISICQLLSRFRLSREWYQLESGLIDKLEAIARQRAWNVQTLTCKKQCVEEVCSFNSPRIPTMQSTRV